MTDTIDVNQDLADLYAAIMARAKGEGIQSLSHKGRSLGYNNVSLADMIKMYRMLWTPASGLPEMPLDLEASSATRGVMHVRMR